MFPSHNLRQTRFQDKDLAELKDAHDDEVLLEVLGGEHDELIRDELLLTNSAQCKLTTMEKFVVRKKKLDARIEKFVVPKLRKL